MSQESAEGGWSEDTYWPTEATPLLEESVSPPPRLPLRAWIAATVAIVPCGTLVMSDGVSGALVASALPFLFVYAGYRILLHRPRHHTLRFFHDGIELDTPGVGFTRVLWDRITKIQAFTDGRANIKVEGAQPLATMPLGSFPRLEASGAIPTAVEIERVSDPPPVTKRSTTKTLLLWVLLIVLLTAAYWLMRI